MFSAIFWPVKWYLGWHAFILVQKLSISYTHVIVIGEFVLNDDTFIKHLKLDYAVFTNIFQWIIFLNCRLYQPFQHKCAHRLTRRVSKSCRNFEQRFLFGLCTTTLWQNGGLNCEDLQQQIWKTVQSLYAPKHNEVDALLPSKKVFRSFSN